MEILFLLIGIAIGGSVVYFFIKSRLQGDVRVYEEKIRAVQELNTELKSILTEKEELIISLTRDISTYQANNTNLQEKLEKQKEDITKLHERFSLEFNNLANKIFEEKSNKFVEQNKNNLDIILKPFHERIGEFQKKVEETYVNGAKERYSLKEEVKRLADVNQQVSKEANALTKALKGESKTQGNWGEVILESILEKSGLSKGREYVVQSSYTNEENRRLQPDVVVHYPGERSIIIDAKVSLVAYEKYVSAEDDAEKNTYLKEHMQSIRNHIKELSEKNYQDIYAIKTLDFVMMFMPVEPAYLLAIQQDSELWAYAYERRILLISPTHLIASLKMIESMWRQEYQTQNVMKIAEEGGKLHDEFVRLIENLVNLGKRLDDAQKFYQNTMKKISEGRGNLVSRVDRLQKLGVRAKKTLPENILNRALDQNDDSENQANNQMP